MDNITLLDVRVKKGFRLAEQNTNWWSGTSFLRPLSIVPLRLARIGVKLEW